MEAYIITGASKGIGAALSKNLAEEGHAVIGISRTVPESWPGIQLFPFDLANSEGVPSLMKEIIEVLPNGVNSITLINNAGTVEPIGFASHLEPQDVSQSIALNLTAPMVLSNSFLKELKAKKTVKRIINISSGAGRKAYKGWSAYCTAKAGLDHFSVCLDEENNDTKVVSVAPGIIDTGMQERIRESKKEEFPLIEHFKDYKEKGVLSTPDDTAHKLIKMWRREDFDSLPVILDLRDI